MIFVTLVPVFFSVVYLYHLSGWQVSADGECGIIIVSVYSIGTVEF